MSLLGIRQDIALALRTVEGVTGYPFRPASPTRGDGWPLLGELERGPGLAFQATWRVVIYLPQDERAASDWIDSKYEDLVDVLQPIGFVERIEPSSIPINKADVYVLVITMRGE